MKNFDKTSFFLWFPKQSKKVNRLAKWKKVFCGLSIGFLIGSLLTFNAYVFLLAIVSFIAFVFFHAWHEKADDELWIRRY